MLAQWQDDEDIIGAALAGTCYGSGKPRCFELRVGTVAQREGIDNRATGDANVGILAVLVNIGILANHKNASGREPAVAAGRDKPARHQHLLHDQKKRTDDEQRECSAARKCIAKLDQENRGK